MGWGEYWVDMVLYIGIYTVVQYGTAHHWYRGVDMGTSGTAHGMRGWHVHPVVVVVASGGTTVASTTVLVLGYSA